MLVLLVSKVVEMIVVSIYGSRRGARDPVVL